MDAPRDEQQTDMHMAFEPRVDAAPCDFATDLTTMDRVAAAISGLRVAEAPATEDSPDAEHVTFGELTAQREPRLKAATRPEGTNG